MGRDFWVGIFSGILNFGRDFGIFVVFSVFGRNQWIFGFSWLGFLGRDFFGSLILGWDFGKSLPIWVGILH